MEFLPKFLAISLCIFTSLASANPVLLRHPLQPLQQIAELSHWTAINGPADSYGYKVVQSNANANVLFAFHHGNIFYRSIDQGKNWELLHAPDEVNISNLVSTAENKLLFATQNAIYASSDLGTTWNKINQDNAEDGYLLKLNPNLIFWVKVNNKQQTYFISRDSGNTWMQINPEIQNAFQTAAARDDMIVVSSQVLSVSYDSGKTFKTIPSQTFYAISALAIDSQHNIYVGDYMNLFKTDANFTTWNDMGAFTDIQEIQIDSQDNFYYSTIAIDGLYEFQHGDRNQRRQPYMGGETPVSFTVLDDGKLILTTRDGFLISNSSQNKFSFMHEKFKSLNTKKILVLDQTHLLEILDTIDVLSSAKSPILYRSDDSGITWQRSFPANYYGVDDIFQFKNKLYLKSNEELYSSDNFGESWKRAGKLPYNFTSLTITPEAVLMNYFGTEYLSDDLFIWKKICKDYDYRLPPTSYVVNGTVYLAQKQNVLASSDRGATWQSIIAGANDKDLCFIHGYQDKVLLATYYKTGAMFKSTDAGKTWTKILADATNVPFVDVVLVDENTYVVASEKHISITHNGGATWQPLEAGIQTQRINKLFVSQNYLFANTKDSGFFQAN